MSWCLSLGPVTGAIMKSNCRPHIDSVLVFRPTTTCKSKADHLRFVVEKGKQLVEGHFSLSSGIQVIVIALHVVVGAVAVD